MTQSLMSLIRAYGDARAGWQTDVADGAPEVLAAIEARIEAIEDAAIQVGVDGETIGALLSGDDE